MVITNYGNLFLDMNSVDRIRSYHRILKSSREEWEKQENNFLTAAVTEVEKVSLRIITLINSQKQGLKNYGHSQQGPRVSVR